MSVDIKDITEVLPFILDNISVSAYIIIISIIIGFYIGKFLEKRKTSKVKHELLIQKELCEKINSEKTQLQKELNDKKELRNNEKANANFTSLSTLERMLDSKDGQVELTALIELNFKKDKS